VIELDVIEANGEVPKVPLRARFEEAGGTVGRAPTNTLSLPDPERTVSRVHAQIIRRQGVVKIVSRSPNGLVVDGTPVGFGDETALTEGATIVMGGYTLRASKVFTRRPGGVDDTTVRFIADRTGG
jgi:FHA domain-containing protein